MAGSEASGAWQLLKEVSGSLSTRLRLIKLHCECHCKVSKMRLAAGRRNHSAAAGQGGREEKEGERGALVAYT